MIDIETFTNPDGNSENKSENDKINTTEAAEQNKKRAKASKEANESFEAKIERLQVISEQMNKNNLSLEDSIALFEEGMRIGTECKKMLNGAEERIKKITEDFKLTD